MFVKAEWVEVPAEHTLDALTHEMLEIKPVDELIAAEVPVAPTPPPMFEVGGKGSKKGGKR